MSDQPPHPGGFWNSIGSFVAHVGSKLDPNMLALLIGLGVLDGLLAAAITHMIELNHDTSARLISACFQPVGSHGPAVNR